MARVGGKGQYFDVTLIGRIGYRLTAYPDYFTDIAAPRRPLGFRPGVHKSESAKEMLLSQTIFGPLPPSPPASSPEVCAFYVVHGKNIQEMRKRKTESLLYSYASIFLQEIDGFPPLPPSPQQEQSEDFVEIVNGIHSMSLSSHSKIKNDTRYSRDTVNGNVDRPPAVPPHRGPSINTLKTR